MSDGRWAIAVHGGAGVINSSHQAWLDDALAGLEAALDAGEAVLAAGGSALDAVVAATVVLEDNPHFNAGKGSVLNAAGRHELEAGVMTSDGRCGAAALLTRVKNPVKLAAEVMRATPHVFLAGPAAEAWAERQGLALVADNAEFTTAQRRAQFERCRAAAEGLAAADEIVQQQQHQHGGGTGGGGGNGGTGGAGGDGAGAAAADASAAAAAAATATDAAAPGDTGAGAAHHTQTVGAVARDAQGRLAAATSTGGRTNKWAGRVGDTPVIGAGTWADARVALSGTGVGEAFQRRAAARDVAARVAYKPSCSLRQALREVVFGGSSSSKGEGGSSGDGGGDDDDDAAAVFAPGDGGFVAVDRDGDAVIDAFNSPGMYRGCRTSAGRREVAIFAPGAGSTEATEVDVEK